MDALKILVVDDELRIRKLLKDFLGKAGYVIIEAADGEEALEKFFKDKDIALVLLDVMMPKLDGWDVLKSIRQYSDTPVVMLTAKDDEKNELTGFELKADDFISKTTSPKVIVARIDALMRRTVAADAEPVEVYGILIDKRAHEVKVDGELIELSVKEFELLTFFVENKGVALSREKILNNVWNYEYVGDARTIDTHVKKLRSKLGEKGEYIKTIWGYGYKFEPEK
ncbi:MAG: response regulator transcription factor [Lachnospiraceae bacterium]|nr:response regulator transcription factor [Lachnospiraceae bacterium]